MPVPVYLPKFDPSHEQSQILNWIVREGDTVREGDPLCEVETDKVNMEVEAPHDGRLAGIRVQAGETVQVAEIIAYVLLDGETEQDIRRALVPVGKVRATPAAKRLAREHDLDLAAITGSGPRGRVQMADVMAVVPKRVPALAALPVCEPAEISESYKLDGMRARIAERMQQSIRSAPHIYVEMPVTMNAALAMREQFKAEGDEVSMTTILVTACARVLTQHPRINATFDGETVSLWRAIHIGIAVALDAGLIVPVIRHADRLHMREIQRRGEDLIARSREGKLSHDEITGATFTISNLGMFGVSRFTAIISPPQVAILAVGGIQRQYVPDENNQPVAQSVMTLALSVDHRILDGADAARFLQDLRKVLENPIRLGW